MSDYVEKIATELKLENSKVRATIGLLAEGATIPFIARYRKEVTGSLDEVVIAQIRDRQAQLEELDKRRQSILDSLTERSLLTDELKAKIERALTLTELEDIYLPYRPKRKTRASAAREKGLEPLAKEIFAGSSKDPVTEAVRFVDAEKGVSSAEDALTGYIRGGVTALACKKPYPVYADETITLYDKVSISAGVRGTQILISPNDYIKAVNATIGDICKSDS
jgi:Transcriptional accessory protein